MNQKEKVEYINRMLSLILESTHNMPNSVFRYYVDYKKEPKEKLFYNLIAESFLTLYSYCVLIFNNAWSQAFALLRIGLEQISSVYVLVEMPGALEEYIKLHDLYKKYILLDSREEKKIFLKEYNVPLNKEKAFFDYGWITKFTEDKTFGRNQIIKMAKLDEFIVDIDETLNSFAHGKISVFQMCGNNWAVMGDYGRRANMTVCKLFDFLCCAIHKLVGDREFNKFPISESFILFKKIYRNYIELSANK
ncbi:MAG: hypothetical protein K6E21_04060 [Bacilli bacterium]|nr:hypothetical protein [Bacilli bacterium]